MRRYYAIFMAEKLPVFIWKGHVGLAQNPSAMSGQCSCAVSGLVP